MASHRPADVEIVVSACRRVLECDGSFVSAITPDQWYGAIATAVNHGLIWPLEKLAAQLDGLPGQVRRHIRVAAQAQASQNLHLTDSLREILHSFRSCGIETAVLKGPALALITTGKIASREFTDLDLLVRFAHLDIARSALASLGYREIGPSLHRTRGMRDRKHITLISDRDRVFVEMHWALNPPALRFPVEATGIWNRLQTISFHGESLATLGLEDTLLALCIHGATHGWESLKWVFDIAQIVQHQSACMDWDALLLRSTIAGCSRSLLVGVHLAAGLFGIREPDLVNRELINDACAMKIAERFRDSVLRKRPVSTLEVTIFRIQVHDRLWDRVVLASTLLIRRLRPTIADTTAVPPLWVLSRLIRLFRSYGLGWLHRAIVAR